MIMRVSLLLLLPFFFIGHICAQDFSIPLDTAEVIFKDVKSICDKDGGKLWGRNIYSPCMFIDGRTRHLVANEPDSNHILVKKGNLYVGNFPETQLIANSVTRLGNKSFSMVHYPLPNEKYIRNLLIVHEMFHYNQPYLGLSLPEGTGYSNSHADDMDARIYFQLEWEALDKAIRADGKTAKTVIRDALVFRAYRQSIYPNEAKDESMFELQEGLPDYTAYMLCSSSDEELKEQLKLSKNRVSINPSFSRQFGYYSGFAYAYLLDKTNEKWKNGLKYDSNLSQLLENAHNIVLPDNIKSAVDKIKNDYGFEAIYESEYKIKAHKDSISDIYIERFTQKPVITIPLEKPNFSFNPSNLFLLGDLGTVYPTFTVIDVWGKLIVNSDGCLVKNWNKGIIPITDDIVIETDKVETKNWTLMLNEGYTIGQNAENYVVKRRD